MLVFYEIENDCIFKQSQILRRWNSKTFINKTKKREIRKTPIENAHGWNWHAIQNIFAPSDNISRSFLCLLFVCLFRLFIALNISLYTFICIMKLIFFLLVCFMFTIFVLSQKRTQRIMWSNYWFHVIFVTFCKLTFQSNWSIIINLPPHTTHCSSLFVWLWVF